MAFMQVAVGAIGIGVALILGYLVLGVVNSQYQSLNLNQTLAGNISTTMNNSQSTIFAGFGIVAVGVIVLAGFGIVNIFR